MLTAHNKNGEIWCWNESFLYF